LFDYLWALSLHLPWASNHAMLNHILGCVFDYIWPLSLLLSRPSNHAVMSYEIPMATGLCADE
jgi:hypothetical protein